PGPGCVRAHSAGAHAGGLQARRLTSCVQARPRCASMGRTTSERTRMTSKQKAGLVLVGAAALILAAATLTRTWFRTDFGLATSEWGLLSRKNCAAETCSTASIGDLS